MPDVTRIIEQTASETIYNDDWLVKDSVNQGTTKIQPSVLKAWINDGMATVEELETVVGNIADTYNTSESYVVDDLCIHEYALYKCIGATTGTWDSTKWQATTIAEIIATIDLSAEAISYDNTSSGLEAENVQDAIDEVDTALETKAEKNGIYDELIAGNLLSDSYASDNAPYLYRQSPSASSVSQNIVGGTVAWNQMVSFNSGTSENNGITFVRGNDGSITVSGTASETATPYYLIYYNSNMLANHKYYITDTGGSNTYGLCTNNDLTKRNSILNGGVNITLTVARGTTVSNVKIIPQMFDLTQAFGSTIADYVYTLEQSTAGSGIAWLKSYGFLTKDYYAYQSGKLESVNVASRKVVGFNQWDEEWELGNYDNTTGAKVDASNRIRSKNYIKCVPNTNYYAKLWQGATFSIRMFYYDANYNFISSPEFIQQGVFTTPNNAYYMTFILATTYGTTYNNDICINISDASKNGTYEPYKTKSYPLDSDLTLRGIPKLDANNNLYYDGDIYKSDGSVKRRYGVVDLGSLSWTKYDVAQGTLFRAYDDTFPIGSSAVIPKLICPKYTTINSASRAEKTISKPDNNKAVDIIDSTYSTADAFKTAMNGVYLVYELATPTTESADAFENPQLVGSTEEFIDTRDVPIPVGGERKYYTDLKAKLEELAKIPDVPSTNGTYTLKATRSASGVTYSWVSG